MKRFNLFLFFVAGIVLFFGLASAELKDEFLDDAFMQLMARKDDSALSNFEKVLAIQPDNLDATWGKAEVLRRRRNYKEAEYLLKAILQKNPWHSSSLNSLAYIRYKQDNYNEAVSLLKKVIRRSSADNKNRALAYLLLGTINGQRAVNGGVICKVKYGTQIKRYLLKAKELAPALVEVHLGLGTFYLLSPGFCSGDPYKAIEELALAVRMAPDFATANARLAQAYRKIGAEDKYNFYINRAKLLDPDNEVLQQLKR